MHIDLSCLGVKYSTNHFVQRTQDLGGGQLWAMDILVDGGQAVHHKLAQLLEAMTRLC